MRSSSFALHGLFESIEHGTDQGVVEPSAEQCDVEAGTDQGVVELGTVAVSSPGTPPGTDQVLAQIKDIPCQARTKASVTRAFKARKVRRLSRKFDALMQLRFTIDIDMLGNYGKSCLRLQGELWEVLPSLAIDR